jgi:predicted hydrocarbon binding protein
MSIPSLGLGVKRTSEPLSPKKVVFPYHYAPGKQLFQVIARIPDKPGSLATLLNQLSAKLNLIGINTYALPDDTAMVVGFASSISGKENADKMKEEIMKSKAVMHAEVREGSNGLLVDTFHTGSLVEGQNHLLLRRDSLSRVFEEIVKIFGSGGDALLYKEGQEMGREDTKGFMRIFGTERIAENSTYLTSILTAEGFGVFEIGPGKGDALYNMKVSECFECAENRGFRRGCNFLRGYLQAAGASALGLELEVKETKCMLRGDEHCEFVISQAK